MRENAFSCQSKTGSIQAVKKHSLGSASPQPRHVGQQQEQSSRPHCLGVSSSKCHHVLFLLFLFIPLSQMLMSSCWAMTAVPAPGQLCARALGLPWGMQRHQGMGPTALCLYYRSAQRSVCGSEKHSYQEG